MKKEIVSNWRTTGRPLEDRLYSSFPLLSYGALKYLLELKSFRDLFNERVTGEELDALLIDIRRFFIPYFDATSFVKADQFYRDLPHTFNLISITDEEDKE